MIRLCMIFYTIISYIMRYRYIYEIGDTHFYAIVQIQE